MSSRPSAEVRQVNEELKALDSITDSALSTLELPALLDALLDRLLLVMNADAGAILLEKDGWLAESAARGFAPGEAPPPALETSSVTRRFHSTGAPRFFADLRGETAPGRSFLREQGVASVAAVPLKANEHLVGLLYVGWRTLHGEDSHDLRLLKIAADRCASAIVNSRLYEELKEARAEADRTNERLTLALSAAELGVWEWDIAARRLVWDEPHARFFGVASPGVSDRYADLERLIHPDDRARLRKTIQGAKEGEPFAPEVRIVRPTGEIRWLSVRGQLHRDAEGRPARLVGVTADVTTERHLAEERELILMRERGARRQAEAAERQIVSILERVTDAFVALDNAWRYTYVSRKAAEIFARRPEDLVGKHIWTEFPEGVGQPFHLAYERAVKEQVPIFFEEYYPPYDKWFENRIYPSPDGLSIFFSDITEKKKMDEKLRATNEQLRALTARLARAREEESARISREIHDEMGQMLTALKLDISGIRSRLSRLPGDEARLLHTRAEEVAGLAEQLQRSVHRISEELRPAALDHLGLEAAVESHLAALREKTGMEASLSGGLGERRLPSAVETGVFRIVQELLTNVVRHAGASRVGVELHASESALTVRVADDGRGVRPEDLSAPRALGLLGMRERAALLGGTFEIGARASGGTEAVVSLPLEKGAP